MYDPEVYTTENEQKNDVEETLLTTVEGGPEDTAQMSMKKGLKLFGAGVRRGQTGDATIA